MSQYKEDAGRGLQCKHPKRCIGELVYFFLII